MVHWEKERQHALNIQMQNAGGIHRVDQLSIAGLKAYRVNKLACSLHEIGAANEVVSAEDDMI